MLAIICVAVWIGGIAPAAFVVTFLNWEQIEWEIKHDKLDPIWGIAAIVWPVALLVAVMLATTKCLIRGAARCIGGAADGR